jgi:hypothetical protein
MDRIREWSFPAVLLTLWVGVAGYTLCSLAEGQARVSAAQKTAAPAVANKEAKVASKQASVTRKPVKETARRGPRA